MEPINSNTTIQNAVEVDMSSHLQKMTVIELFGGKITEELSGNSGTVYLIDRGESVVPRNIVAKTVKIKSETGLARFMDECKKWAKVNSPFVATAFYIEKRYTETFLCMKFGDQSLLSFLKTSTLTDFGAIFIATQLAYGLRDMKRLGVSYHQDYNPQNILVQDFSKTILEFPPKHYDDAFRFRIMLSDFGMADYFAEDPINGARGGKFAYKAPEQYENSEIIGFDPDIFSFGVIVTLLLSDFHPCGNAKEKILSKRNPKTKGGWEYWAKQGNRVVNLKSPYSIEIANMLRRCLSIQPLDRPNIEEVIAVLNDEASKIDDVQFEIMKFHLSYLYTSFCKSLSGEIRVYQS